MNSNVTTIAVLPAAERWENAINEIRNQDVQIIENVEDCCPGCIRADMLEIFDVTDENGLIAYTFGGDGYAHEWNSTDTMVYKDDGDRKDSVHFYQGSIYQRNGSGPIIAAAFRANGFVVRWDGGESSLLEVFPNENGSRQDEYVLVS